MRPEKKKALVHKFHDEFYALHPEYNYKKATAKYPIHMCVSACSDYVDKKLRGMERAERDIEKSNKKRYKQGANKGVYRYPTFVSIPTKGWILNGDDCDYSDWEEDEKEMYIPPDLDFIYKIALWNE